MLRYRLILFLLFFPVLQSGAVTVTQSAWGKDKTETLASSKALYRQNCAVCHGITGNGKGLGGRGLTPPPANFTDPEFWKNKTDSFLTHVISNGIGEMPAWSETLTPTQIRDILSYIRTFRKH